MFQAFTTVFEVRGLGQVLTAYSRVQATQTRLGEKEQELRDKFGKLYNQLSDKDKALELRDALTSAARAQVSMLTSSAIALTAFVRGMDRVIESYTRWGAAVMDVRDLTGASTRESVRAMNLLNAGGVNQSVAPKILNLSKDVFTGQGAGALARLGIPANPNQTGLQLFDQIAEKMSHMQNSMLKAQIGTQLFGEEGYRSLLPLLRLTKDQREEAMGIGQGFGGANLARIQEFTTKMQIFGASFQQNVLFPLADKFIQVLNPILTAMQKLVNFMGWLDQTFAGVPSWIGTFVALSVAILLVVRVVQSLVATYTALRSAVIAWTAAQAASEAILGGPAAWTKLVVGTAVAASALAGVNAVMGSSSNPGATGQDDMRKFSNSVNKFDESVNRMGDSFDNIKGGNIPNGLTETDIQSVGRQRALGMLG